MYKRQTYQRVENTSWDVLCTVDFAAAFAQIFPSLVLVGCLTILLCLGLMAVLQRYIARQMQVVDMLVHSVGELEKKMCIRDRCRYRFSPPGRKRCPPSGRRP